MTINGVDFGRCSLGTRDEISQEQNVNVMGDGTFRVRDVEAAYQVLTVTWGRLTNTQWEALKAMIQYAAKFSGASVTLVDDYAVSRTVRYWKDSLRGESRGGRYWTAEATFRVVA